MIIEIVENDNACEKTNEILKSRVMQISGICKALKKARDEKIAHIKKYGGDLDKVQEFDAMETSFMLFNMNDKDFDRIAKLTLG